MQKSIKYETVLILVMYKLFFLHVCLCFCFQTEAQTNTDNEIIEDNSISAQLYTKCFPNLKYGDEIFEKYPAFKDAKICSLLYCTLLFEYNDEEISLIAENRLRGIATQLYREGNPVILLSGMDSSLTAKEKNENLLDDNHIVYISIAACVIRPNESRAQKIINQQTTLLINQN